MPTFETTSVTTSATTLDQSTVWLPAPPWWAGTQWTQSTTTSSITELYTPMVDTWTTNSITSSNAVSAWILHSAEDAAFRGRLPQDELIRRRSRECERQWRLEARRAERAEQMQRSVDAVMGAEPERAAVNQAAAAEGRAVYERLQTARSAARQKARALLLSRLTPEQADHYSRLRFFYVRAPSGHRYRIRHGRARNVEHVDDLGNRLATLCAHPAIDCPDEDTMLTQMLWLQSNEAQFLQVANRS